MGSNEISHSEHESTISIVSAIQRPKTAFGIRHQENETKILQKTSKLILPPLEVRSISAENENVPGIKTPTSSSSKLSDSKSKSTIKKSEVPLQSMKLEKLDLKSNKINKSSIKINHTVLSSAKNSDKSSLKDTWAISSVEEKNKPNIKKEAKTDVSENSKILDDHRNIDIEQRNEKSREISNKEDTSLSMNDSNKTLLSTKLQNNSSKNSESESSCTEKSCSEQSKELTESEVSEATNKSPTSSSKISSTSSESTSRSKSYTSNSLENSLSSKTAQNTVTKLSKSSLKNDKNTALNLSLGGGNENSYSSSDEDSNTLKNKESSKLSSKDDFFDEESKSIKSVKLEENSEVNKVNEVNTKSKNLLEKFEENEKVESEGKLLEEKALSLSKALSSESLVKKEILRTSIEVEIKKSDPADEKSTADQNATASSLI